MPHIALKRIFQDVAPYFPGSNLARDPLLALQALRRLARASRTTAIERGFLAGGEATHILPRHILDSLWILQSSGFRSTWKRESSLADFGSGAGFPGLVLAICLGNPLTCFDSLQKRAVYLEETIGELRRDFPGLGLQIEVVVGRIEDPAIYKPHRGRYPLAVSRAFLPIGMAVELIFPYLAQANGCYYYYGGRSAALPMEKLQAELAATDLELAAVERWECTPMGSERCFLAFRKHGPRPTHWPRAFGKIKQHWSSDESHNRV